MPSFTLLSILRSSCRSSEVSSALPPRIHQYCQRTPATPLSTSEHLPKPFPVNAGQRFFSLQAAAPAERSCCAVRVTQARCEAPGRGGCRGSWVGLVGWGGIKGSGFLGHFSPTSFSLPCPTSALVEPSLQAPVATPSRHRGSFPLLPRLLPPTLFPRPPSSRLLPFFPSFSSPALLPPYPLSFFSHLFSFPPPLPHPASPRAF